MSQGYGDGTAQAACLKRDHRHRRPLNRLLIQREKVNEVRWMAQMMEVTLARHTPATGLGSNIYKISVNIKFASPPSWAGSLHTIHLAVIALALPCYIAEGDGGVVRNGLVA